MSRKIYTMVNGVLVEKRLAEEIRVHSVRSESMPKLKHPVTGKIIESRSEWERTNREHGLKCVGNDVLSKYPNRPPEKITDPMILDRIARAEAILSDPARRRAHHNMNLQLIERNERLLRGQRG